jgi:hypothetical protein
MMSISSSVAQGDFRPGFIIKAEHDTVYGEVEFRSRGKSYEACKLRKDGNTTEYNNQQVIGYGLIADKYYASGIIEGYLSNSWLMEQSVSIATTTFSS